MQLRFTLLTLLGLTTWCALFSAAIGFTHPLWRIFATYALFAFTPGLLVPLFMWVARRLGK